MPIPKSTSHRTVYGPAVELLTVPIVSTLGAEVNWEGAIRGRIHTAFVVNSFFRGLFEARSSCEKLRVYELKAHSAHSRINGWALSIVRPETRIFVRYQGLRKILPQVYS